jgi:hypothetical protein
MRNTAICRNIQNNHIYRHIGENRFKNLTTGVEGEIEEASANKVLKINLELTQICNQYPVVEDAISALGLKLEK